HSILADQHGQADIDGVAIENAGKAACDDYLYATARNRNRSMLARRPAAEIMPRHNHIARLHLLRELWQDFAETMTRQFRPVGRDIIAPRNDHIGIDIIAKHPDTAHGSILPSLLKKRARVGDMTGQRGRGNCGGATE